MKPSKQDTIQIGSKVQQQLDRLIAIEHSIEWDEVDWLPAIDGKEQPPAIVVELRELRASLADKFLPIIRQLCAANLIEIWMNMEDTDSDRNEYAGLSAHDLKAYEDGGIKIWANWDGCGMHKSELHGNDEPVQSRPVMVN
jgi:hypothetical protein